jgi:alpha-beta hydrolase superfamily lysophospholipase
MQHTTDQFLAAGGVTIFTQAWTPADGPPKALIVLAHGFGEHSGRYQHVAKAFTDAGYGVATFDHRGHGRSGGPRARVSDISQLSADLALYRAEVATRFDQPQILLGHSVGGAVVLHHLQQDHPPVKAVVLSAPYIRNAAPVSAPLKFLSPIIGRVVPAAPTVKLDANSVSRDPAVVSAYENDPLVFHGKIPAGTAATLLSLEQSLLTHADRVSEPTLILHGVEDQLADVAGSRDLARRLGSEVVELKTYDGLHHEVFNEPEQDEVLADVTSWLDDHL